MTKDIPFKYCRTCYDHIAGKAGVTITHKLIAHDILLISRGNIWQYSSPVGSYQIQKLSEIIEMMIRRLAIDL